MDGLIVFLGEIIAFALGVFCGWDAKKHSLKVKERNK